jgi:cyclomaltodextrinase
MRAQEMLARAVMEEAIQKGIYQHFKGNYYELVHVARHSETMEEFIVYKQLYGDGGLWVRPLQMFCEQVVVASKPIPRFRYVGEAMDATDFEQA